MPVIVISGVPGAGSSTIAKLLAKKLGLKHFSLGDASKEFGQGKETEKAISYLQSESGRSRSFHEKMDEHQREIAKSGNVVIDAKLGIRMLKGMTDFSVWLECPVQTRAERVAKRDSVPVDVALKTIKTKEEIEKKTWKDIYGFDYFDQEGEAKLVIETGNKTPEEIVNIIIEGMKRKGS